MIGAALAYLPIPASPRPAQPRQQPRRKHLNPFSRQPGVHGKPRQGVKNRAPRYASGPALKTHENPPGITPVAAEPAVGCSVAAERGAVDVALDIPKSPQVTRIQAMLSRYPEVIDLRTGRPLSFPSDIGTKIPKSDRVAWGANQRSEFISDWNARGYADPKGGWSNYDIHHIKPREYGGTNDFWNLTPVARQTHKELNSFWRGFTGL